ncbi:MAG: hypothetical protein EOS03_12445 [Mesorhizobium sp.]|uniref:hypothetical protein n=1 Tax=Mesorhizobium sp. TaxID=1871066 RepID=UPI000FE6D5FC|nr:hypothetical protein [Mesorhizobium sp.]RWN47161.1 MAG: hypothetical protein EOS03_12445 [Mesorhizobium sp.]
MRLEIVNPGTTEAFVAALAGCGVKLPLALHSQEVGSVIDADNHEVFVVDVHSELSDEVTEYIASWLVLAVNTCGGFKAVRT